ncbi:MAG TPA: hypothetical protein VGJ05_20695 [Fimbriiglobus sp.]|jgi:hypothetical protein
MKARNLNDTEIFISLTVPELHGEELEAVIGGFDERQGTVLSNWLKPQQPAPFKDVFAKVHIG